MTLALTFLISGTGCVLSVAGALLLLHNRRCDTGRALVAIGNWLVFLNAVAVENYTATAINGSIAAVTTWLWWRNGGGPRTRKTVRQLGAKSAARITALVRNIGPAPARVPGPVAR